jgi:hypothetical protein
LGALGLPLGLGLGALGLPLGLGLGALGPLPLGLGLELQDLDQALALHYPAQVLELPQDLDHQVRVRCLLDLGRAQENRMIHWVKPLRLILPVMGLELEMVVLIIVIILEVKVLLRVLMHSVAML